MKLTPNAPEAGTASGGYRLVAAPGIAVPGFAPARRHLNFNAADWGRLGGFYGLIALLHLIGCGLFLHYAANYSALIGLGFAAYMFGLRHAFDADHIAAVDDTVRYLLQKGQKPLGIGFFFSLGHSTVVFVLALAMVFAATTVKQELPELQHFGGLIGASVSGVFLWLIGILNLLLLLDMLKIWRQAKGGQHGHAHLDELLAKRGLLNRLLGGRLQRLIRHSWQMYPLGLLFGLGFDTASEISLLAMTAGAASGNLPIGAVLSLPILFAAGMSLMDTTDGVLMVKAYDWAFVNPLRKIFYNLTTTSLSIAVALVIGSIELLQVLIGVLVLKGPIYDYVGGLDLGALGYVIVGLFLLVWGVSAALWKLRRIEERCDRSTAPHTHEHTHAGGVTHVHEHFH
ncbi:MAG TPA: HoxN/HupN/NixA family nickel/cobalt transporter [Thiobacillaceae bacterium]|nr:HoxN/HupN/NixA family nickel/cobalt transporter [Thiobacillaceae bacterium]